MDKLPGKKWELCKETNKAKAVCDLCDISYEMDWEVEFPNKYFLVNLSNISCYSAKQRNCMQWNIRQNGWNSKTPPIRRDSDKLAAYIYICAKSLTILHKDCTCSHNTESMLKLCKAWLFLCLNPTFCHIFVSHNGKYLRLFNNLC